MLPEIKTILYATDLGGYTSKVFRYAMGLAQRHDANIVLVHAVEPLTPSARSQVELYLPPETAEALQTEGRRRLLEAIRGRIEHFCDRESCVNLRGESRVSEIRIVEGRPAEVILDEEESCGADLIVMGSHGHSAVGELLLGSTAHRVTLRARAPVLLVRIRPDDVEEEP